MHSLPSRILITGANGFIAKTLKIRLAELPGVEVFCFSRETVPEELPVILAKVDAVIHLAGENRPADESAFETVNVGLTNLLCTGLEQLFLTNGKRISVVFSSSTQAALNNPYGRSKLTAEARLQQYAESTGSAVTVFRLPGVFGKWCKPNYNSVVATFCHNLARGLPIQITNPQATLKLAYVDDVVDALLAALSDQAGGFNFSNVSPEYSITLGELAAQLQAFNNCRTNLLGERVGTGLTRALYSTYISYLPESDFSYPVPAHADSRGVFVEMLKTADSGQFSYFTAHPGITRGGHYHHTKTEKFLVVKGKALFKFRHLLTGELVEIETNGDKPQVVDTIPGWAHDITNIGEDEMVVMLWANENFDKDRPDTVARKITP